MLIYKNKATGKSFILIDEDGNEKGLFINPDGTIIELEYALFDDDPIELGDHDEKTKELLSGKQIKRFFNHQIKEIERNTKTFWEIIKDLPALKKIKKEKPEEFSKIIESLKKQAPGFDPEDFD